jgi:3-isopropylmalate/(R)-2-methylmalate dehydratase small subunit
VAIERITGVRGTAIPLRGDNIDTDRIIPARFLKSISFEGLEDHLFEDDRKPEGRGAGEPAHPFSNPAYAGASVLIVNANFGCGSSREHAPQAIRRRGIRAVIGESFSEIFFGNAVALGLPCVTASSDDVEMLMQSVERDPAVEVAVDLERMRVDVAGRQLTVHMPAAARESFVNGTWDATGLLLDRYEEVQRVAARLPYLTGW